MDSAFCYPPILSQIFNVLLLLWVAQNHPAGYILKAKEALGTLSSPCDTERGIWELTFWAVVLVWLMQYSFGLSRVRKGHGFG